MADLFNLESLGITKEDLITRLVDKIAEDALTESGVDEWGDFGGRETTLARMIDARIKTSIDAAVSAQFEKHVASNVESYIEGFTIKSTNTYGEAIGKTLTFTEYLVKRADEYMVEKVDFEGKTAAESRGFSHNAAQTRITYLVDKYLHHKISIAAQETLGGILVHITDGLTETARIKLAEAAKNLTITVKTK